MLSIYTRQAKTFKLDAFWMVTVMVTVMVGDGEVMVMVTVR